MRPALFLAAVLLAFSSCILPRNSSVTPTASPRLDGGLPIARQCLRNNLLFVAQPDQVRYPPGAKVGLSVKISNHSVESCTVRLNNNCIDPGVRIVDSLSQTVWESSRFPPPCPAVPLDLLRPLLEPGQSVARSYEWDQHACGPDSAPCTGAQVPAGTYSVQGDAVYYGRSALAPFQIVGPAR